MLFLILAIASSAMIAVLMRISSDQVRKPLGMLLANYLVCAILGCADADFQIFLSREPGFFTALTLGCFNGFIYLASFMLFQQATRKNGVVLSSVFMKLGLLVPIVLSVLVFREIPSSLQILGFILAVFSIVLINYQKGHEKTGPAFRLILLLLLGGCTDAMSKVYEFYGSAALSDHFLAFTFCSALVVCAAAVAAGKEWPGKKELIYGALIGIPNFFSSKFLLAALTEVPAVVAYPTFSVATMLLVTLAGTVFFREKLSKSQAVALGTILFALALLNL